ncbi:MAG: hypothetical protein QXT72_02090 [Candidatus Micrarchaeia archaeon]
MCRACIFVMKASSSILKSGKDTETSQVAGLACCRGYPEED